MKMPHVRDCAISVIMNKEHCYRPIRKCKSNKLVSYIPHAVFELLQLIVLQGLKDTCPAPSLPSPTKLIKTKSSEPTESSAELQTGISTSDTSSSPKSEAPKKSVTVSYYLEV